jgi:tellurite resistance protein TerC
VPDHLLAWIGFAFVLAMLALDLGIFHRKSREDSLQEALTWSAIWIGLALAFNAGIYYDNLSPSRRLLSSIQSRAEQAYKAP